MRYKFSNHEHLEKAKVPITIMHGSKDELIYFGSSVKLSKYFKPGDTLIIIENGGHSIHHENELVQDEFKRILHSNQTVNTMNSNN